MAYQIIDHPETYLEAWPTAIPERMRLLDVPLFTQKDCSTETRNCTLTAITRLLAYHTHTDATPCAYMPLYAHTDVWARRLGYHPRWGSLPLLISTMTAKTFARAGHPAHVRSHYFSATARCLQHHIDAGQPLILNIAFGPYRLHSLTVCGYARYRQDWRNPLLIAVVDGWQPKVRWLHWQALRLSTPLSLTTVTPYL